MRKRDGGGLLSLLLLVLLSRVEAGENGIRNKIYTEIDSSHPCFRKTNGTHQVGCASSLTGDVGVVHLLEGEDSMKWITKEGPHAPYVVALYPSSLNYSVMMRLKGTGRVAGVLVLGMPNVTKDLKSFSQDDKCPNKGLGLYTQKQDKHYCEKWNEAGEGLLFENFDFPIFYVKKEKEGQEVIDCFNKFNRPTHNDNKVSARDWPLCAAQLKSFMAAAVDTPTCLRRSNKFTLDQQTERVCDPMGDQNLWTSLVPTNQSDNQTFRTENGSVILVSARLDAASLFDGLAHGADSAGTGTATFLAVLKHLATLKDQFLNNSGEISNIYFVLFQGEAFGYIGSSRMVYDMLNGDFPSGIKKEDVDAVAKLNITDIKYYIEIGQVGITKSDQPFFIHESNVSQSQYLSNVLASKGREQNLNFLNVQNAHMGLPPSSIQSFLKARPSIPGIVITNHEKEFTNQFYSSMYDNGIHLNYNYHDVQNLLPVKIASLSAAIANTILSVAGRRDLAVNADVETANELLHCYVQSGKCALFQNITENEKIPDSPLDLYVGVNRYYILSTQLTRYVMMYYQGSNVTTIRVEDDCKAPDNKPNVFYHWINGTCYETSVNISEALSPAFKIENYDWKSGQYSTWTESVWQQFSVRIFLKPSKAHDIATLVSGIVVFIFSFLLIGWISSKSDIIFPTRPAGMAC